MNYIDIRNNLNDWLARSDLNARADDFLEIVQNRVNRVLRIRPMEKFFFDTMGEDGTVLVPDDYIEIKNFYTFSGDIDQIGGADSIGVAGGDFPLYRLDYLNNLGLLERTSAEMIYRKWNGNNTDCPRYIARTGQQFILRPLPPEPLFVGGFYYARLPILTEAEPVNWLTVNAPDLLLFGALKEASAFIKDDRQEQYWGNRFEAAMAELAQQDSDEQHSGSQLQMRVV